MARGEALDELNLSAPDQDLLAFIRKSEFQSALGFYSELFFAILFTVEFIIRTIAQGFAFMPEAYLRSGWNWIDLMVLASTWAQLTVTFVDGSGLPRTIRMVRSLRPLRLVAKFTALRSTFELAVQSMVCRQCAQLICVRFISVLSFLPTTIYSLKSYSTLGCCYSF